MPYRQLGDFLTALHDDGDLLRIRDEVDPDYELAEIVRQVAHQSDGGPAMVFDNVRGSSRPVATNLFGTQRRLCRALGVANFDDAANRLLSSLLPEVPEGLLDAVRLLPRLSQLAGSKSRLVKTGSCQQVVRMGSDVDLTALPVPRCWLGETGPTITAGQLSVRDPQSGQLHVGRYRLQVTGANTLVPHWHEQHPAWHILHAYRALKQPMPVAIALGGHPLLTYAASPPLPPGLDALQFAGLLSGEGVDLVRARTVELDVPADAELIIEGSIHPGAEQGTGAVMTSESGLLIESSDLPTLTVAAVTHRANPLIPAIIPAAAPGDEHTFGKLTERLLLPLIRLYLPELVDINAPAAAGGGRLLFASIAKQFPRQARKVMDALCNLRPWLGVKFVVVVDADVDVQDESAVWRAVGTHLNAAGDVSLTEAPGDRDDPSHPVPGLGTRLGIDATRKLPAERGGLPPILDALPPPATQAAVSSRLRELGLLPGPGTVHSGSRG